MAGESDRRRAEHERAVDFEGRVAVVTGAASGIGRALAHALAREGAHVVVADVDQQGNAQTAEGVRARGREALALVTDVSERAQVVALAERAFAHFGAVHVLVNNAGVVLYGEIATASHADWQWVLGVNLWGVIHGLEAFLPRMVAQRTWGHVVNTASLAGLVASRGLGVYTASKYAVVGLSETLARELAPHGIGVSVLCPLGVATRLGESERHRPARLHNPAGTPARDAVSLIGRTLSPEEVAERTLAAIRAGELYVLTHSEGLLPLRRRFARIEEAGARQLGDAAL